MVLLRRLLGDVLRRHRQRQSRTLREVAATARVSLGYLSEVERGQKEASSELLAAICDALGVPLAAVLREVSDAMAGAATPGFRPALVPAMVPDGGQQPVAVGVAAGASRLAGAGVAPVTGRLREAPHGLGSEPVPAPVCVVGRSGCAPDAVCAAA